jgi:hypothetical protein
VTVRLYRIANDRDAAALAAAPPKDTFTILTDEQVAAKAPLLLAEGGTDAEGRFTISLPDDYEGGPFEIDVYCPRPPRGRVSRHAAASVQFSITALEPNWHQDGDTTTAEWEYCLDARYWCEVLRRFGIWSICGHLVTCIGSSPIPGATVRAFDRDWTQDDSLGSAVTDADGHFLITYVAEDFKRTPLPFVHIELIGGPDVYFSAELGGTMILQEDPEKGREVGRSNIGPCFCVDLCSDQIVGSGGPETVPHWMQVEEVFNVHPDAGQAGSCFSIDGYASPGPTPQPTVDAYVFGGGISLNGNCPLTNIATGNPVKYRFLLGEWTWSGTPDEPTIIPAVPPGPPAPVVAQFEPTLVGYVSYIDGNGDQQWGEVIVEATDADGWITVDGMAVTVPMYNPSGSTSVQTVGADNFLETFNLANLNTAAVTSVHPAKFPGGLAQADAGQSLTTAQEEPIRRYQLQFEAIDTVTAAVVASTGDNTLSSIIFDNSPVIAALDLEELLNNLCNPIGAGTDVHVLYTVDHPHLRQFSVSISNNNGQVHPPPAFSGSPTVAMPNGDYAPGDYFFRGGASGTGGVAVDISADPACAYRVSLSWLARHWGDIGTGTEILYCKTS